MKNLHGKVALITGGTKGIGFGIAEALLKQGINVAITSRNKKSAEEAAKKLNGSGNDSVHAIGLEADVRDYASQQQAVEATIKEFGKIDVVVANAGLGHFGSIEDITVDQWNEVIETNLTGAFYSLKAAVAALKDTKGYYITISSLAGTNFFEGGTAYNASKFGVTGFTQAAMLDLRKHEVKVSTIMPGSVSTHFNGNEPSDKGAWKIQIEDLGELVVDLLKMHPRTLPSKIEVRPTVPPSAKK
ncbi:MAG TPA: SDR family oxidoreductase [Flavobacteriaceae bacterium]|nr:short-chain dehydrogenase [Flavobacteriaceae bacterium]MAY52853.1 short-chain dehydrogenase [Flavobacteriaceae bacterium]HBR54488.1 short-chain dehydrogenase [Flavobacteriaceae bacterium]HIB47905.1 SDR family oxidoreductase [Flavobacteriaceae bacterium]HIN99365.1 SDR family oxidoreductase [Flavobacteriaceae bacterium]|tara:strand:+ start:515 stop:1246 length:732 start_codon:yes stop_codon:yes gene_type:complete